MILSILAAASENNVLGKDNALIWHLGDDTAFFKKKTLEHTVIMGRKTFDSMGKPLPKRRNIVISRNETLKIPGTEVKNTLESALQTCESENEVFLIGGAELYQLALPLTDIIYLTRVHTIIDGDAYFPEINLDIFKLVHSDNHIADLRNDYGYTFLTYERR